MISYLQKNIDFNPALNHFKKESFQTIFWSERPAFRQYLDMPRAVIGGLFLQRRRETAWLRFNSRQSTRCLSHFHELLSKKSKSKSEI